MGTKKWSEIKNRAPVPEELRKAAEVEMRAEIREYNLTELRRLVSAQPSPGRIDIEGPRIRFQKEST